MQVYYRSEIGVVEVRRNRWQYHFRIRLEDRSEHIIVGFASGTRDHAIAAALRHSGRLIDKGMDT